jgi:hypothetical protein
MVLAGRSPEVAISFEFKKCASHGTSNPIVARLSLQNLQILENCKVTKEVKDQVGGLYLESLMKKLLRCWEIEDSFKKSFAEAAATYKPPAMANAPVEIPQIERLEADCHNFLYEAKNYIRDVLHVVYKLYSTSLSEESGFSTEWKGGKSLIEFATETFGPDDARTKMLIEPSRGSRKQSRCVMRWSIPTATAAGLLLRTSGVIQIRSSVSHSGTG